jgi:hypothetical protein
MRGRREGAQGDVDAAIAELRRRSPAARRFLDRQAVKDVEWNRKRRSLRLEHETNEAVLPRGTSSRGRTAQRTLLRAGIESLRRYPEFEREGPSIAGRILLPLEFDPEILAIVHAHGGYLVAPPDWRRGWDKVEHTWFTAAMFLNAVTFYRAVRAAFSSRDSLLIALSQWPASDWKPIARQVWREGFRNIDWLREIERRRGNRQPPRPLLPLVRLACRILPKGRVLSLEHERGQQAGKGGGFGSLRVDLTFNGHSLATKFGSTASSHAPVDVLSKSLVDLLYGSGGRQKRRRRTGAVAAAEVLVGGVSRRSPRSVATLVQQARALKLISS